MIPSIDIMDGKAVQLEKGEKKKLEVDDVMGLAERFSLFGEIAVIDLDAAMGKGNNKELIKSICRRYPCRVGGGIRNKEVGDEYLMARARKIIIGTMASPDFLSMFNPDRVIAAVDSRDMKVVDSGWTNDTGADFALRMKELEPYCSAFLWTNVDIEGTLGGIDREIIKSIQTKNRVTVAGGIRSVEDIRYIEDMGMEAQLGMLIYKENIEDIFLGLIDFSKRIVPTIVQDEQGRVLMLAYSSKESLSKCAMDRKATYYSRSRKRLWTKGMTSGNTQEILKIDYDCDRDSLLFTVRQKGEACHTGSYSCFTDKDFSLKVLAEVIRQKRQAGKKESYTRRLLSDISYLKEKIIEESKEVVDFRDRDNLVWELSDLLYFMMVLMEREGVSLDDVENELWRRRR